jgi:glycosyltransferase involved in cell wall biosynthesis
MRILLWHGYLLGGTGSNVYTRSIAREWSRAGHDVVVVSQEANPELHDLGGAQTVRPDIGGLLPVFVLDRYEGMQAKLLQDTSQEERGRFVEANASALRELSPADLVFANHVLLGGPVGAASGLPFAVKAHGSELEYSMRGNEELARWGRKTLADARAVFVGSGHIREVLEAVVGHVARVYEVPPGVDVETFRPEARPEALRKLLEEAVRDQPNPGNANERLPDDGNAERLEAFLAEEAPTLLYFGKLIRNKGVHLLLEALERVDARAVIVGFGDYRAELEAMAGPHVIFTGPLEHRHLVHLIPLAHVTVVPSIFPEASGWSPPKPPPPVRFPWSRGTPAWGRSRTRWRRRASPRRSCRATSTTWSRSSIRFSGDQSRSARSSGAAPAASSRSGGRGRPWPTACSSRSKAPTRRRRPERPQRLCRCGRL